MALVASAGIAHIRLNVTDITRSKTFYDQVFGWPIAVDASTEAGQSGVRESPTKFYGGVIYRTPSGALFGLRPVGTQRFNPEHTGLDHLTFMVASRGDLVQASRTFDETGVEDGEVMDLPNAGIAILSFSDPDGVQLELCARLD